jgi:hypothetical protein
MNVAEMIEWLKTQDQDAVVQVAVEGREVDFNPTISPFKVENEVGGEHWHRLCHRNKPLLILGEG